MATNYEGEEIDFGDELPLLPVRDIVVYPYIILPLFVGRDSSIRAVEEALKSEDRLILLASQKDIKAEKPSPADIYELGTIAMIMRMRKLPDGRIKILVQGLSKARITEFKGVDPFFKVSAEKVQDYSAKESEVPVKALMLTIREQLEKIINFGKVLSPDILMVLEDISDPGRLSDLVASNLNLHVAEAQLILEILDPVERLQKINDILSREIEILSMQAKIRSSAKDEISRNQKEYFLREQIRAIKSELGEAGSAAPEDEFSEFREKIVAAQMNEDTEKECLKQLSRLEKMHPDSSESSILRNYLEWMVDLPWKKSMEREIDLDWAKEVLDADHFELEKVKERILEYLAVRKLKGGNIKGPILCFSGPPGVGKTSLGKSIAKATGRKFVRISLGGIKDEAEIRGHRRTYVGSMPGRFIQALKQAGTNNPVILLDEVDKLGGDYKGDPSSALLEVLDPEQNSGFRDHYLNVPYDLSNVMFLATANILEQIPAPLRDRMEVIQLSGYSQEEKLAISKKYLVPKQMDENGIANEHVEFHEDGLKSVIQDFTAEAGLRSLEKKIGALCRKVAVKIARGEVSKTHMRPEMVEKLLGPPIYQLDDRSQTNEIGVATGLAWTEAGGQLLSIEASMMKGKGLGLTGKLGEVMKESAQAVLAHIRSRASEYLIDEEIFEENAFHIHLPAGAIPKDGPSAGIGLGTALVSLLTGHEVDQNVAMTGEMTLTGKVLPIGGLKEKALAAMRMNIKTVIFPEKNQKDLVDIPEEFRRKINFVAVKHFEEVLDIALVNWKRQKELARKVEFSAEKKLPPAAA